MAQTVYDPPVSTYIPLQTITLGSAASSVTFADIPQTYRDLVIVMDASASGTAGGRMFPNNDTASTYNTIRMYGDGSSAVSSTITNTYGYIGDVFTSKTPIIIQLFDYSATDKHKSWLYRMNSSANYVMAGASRWPSTDAITSLVFTLNSGTYSSGTTFSLYGIEA